LIDLAPYDWMGTTDGVDFSVHTYSPSHVYKLYYEGTGSPLNFSISDTHYGDNSGSLTVTIIPEPATLSVLALGGLALLRRSRK